MRMYSNTITLSENGRGIWTLDPIFGCKTGIEKNKKGCFGDCYSARSARIYNYNFHENTLRDFKNEKHKESIRKKIDKLEFPFIRMGNNGDPSENWDHTIKIIEEIQPINKQVIIITRHWNLLTIDQLKRIKKLNICINTSISAIDEDIHNNINQYELLKGYCDSVLRCVSFDFNTKNKKGMGYNLLQDYIFNTYEVLDTVFRCGKSNEMYKEGIINIKETKFLGKKCFVSKKNKKTYFGNCNSCLEKCGLNM